MRSIKLYIMALLLPIGAWAQQEKTWPLDSVLVHIERQNIHLRSYESRVKAIQAKAEAATAWMAPMVGAGTYMTPYPGQKRMGSGDNGSLMFQLEQEIPTGGKRAAKQKQLQAQAQLQQIDRLITLKDYQAQAQKLYYKLQLANRKKVVLADSKVLLEMIKKIAQIRYTYNQNSLSSIYQAEAKVEQNLNSLSEIQSEEQQNYSWLKALMNMPESTVLKIDTQELVLALPVKQVDSHALLQQKLSLKKMEAEIQASRLEMEAMKLERKPVFKLRLDHMSPLSSMMPHSYSIMGMLSIPMAPWSKKMYEKEVQALQYEVQALNESKQQTLRASEGLVYSKYRQLADLKARITRMDDKIIPALQRAFDASFLAYQENKQSLNLLLNDWEALLEMKNTLLDEKLNLYLSLVDYEQALYQ